MKHAPLRHRLEFAAYRTVLTAFQSLPNSLALRAGRGLGRVAGLALRSDRRLAVANMLSVLADVDEELCRRTVAQCYRHYGETLAVVLRASNATADELRENVAVEGAEHIAAARERGRGMIFIGAHIGYWELAALMIGMEVGRVAVVYRPLDNPYINQDVVSLRDRFGITLVPKTGAATPLFRALKRGGAIGLLADQRVPRRQGVLVPFLGRPAWTTSLPALLTQRTGCAVISAFCEPTGNGRSVVRFGAPLGTELSPHELEAARVRRAAALAQAEETAPEAAREAQEDDEGVAALTARIMEPLEEVIRARPDLWLWAHRRWKLV